MIASLRGTVISIGLNHAVIECGGVGYRVLATPAMLGTLTRGEEAFVLTTLVVKEDSQTLFGFGSADDREMFHVLQSVSGVGAKLAMAALSVMGAGELSAAISAGDAKRLQTIPGVGKRVAERLALELKDKVAGFAGAAPAESASAAPAAHGPEVEQVVEALVGLGFTDKLARPAVDAVIAEKPDVETSELLRSSLALLSQKK